MSEINELKDFEDLQKAQERCYLSGDVSGLQLIKRILQEMQSTYVQQLDAIRQQIQLAEMQLSKFIN